MEATVLQDSDVTKLMSVSTLPNDRPTVILIESSRLVREGMLGILQPAAFRVAAAVPTPEAALAALTGPLGEEVIDLLLCSLEPQQDMSALLRALALLQQHGTIARTVLLLPACTTEDMTLAVVAGIDGLILKDISGNRLLRALDLVLNGQGVLPVGAATQILALVRESGEPAPLAPPPPPQPAAAAPRGHGPLPRNPNLSDRERQILQCLVEGCANKLIARRLSIAEATVKVHIKGLLRKINVSNRTQAAIWALNHTVLARGREATGSSAEPEEGGEGPQVPHLVTPLLATAALEVAL